MKRKTTYQEPGMEVIQFDKAYVITQMSVDDDLNTEDTTGDINIGGY